MVPIYILQDLFRWRWPNEMKICALRVVECVCWHAFPLSGSERVSCKYAAPRRRVAYMPPAQCIHLKGSSSAALEQRFTLWISSNWWGILFSHLLWFAIYENVLINLFGSGRFGKRSKLEPENSQISSIYILIISRVTMYCRFIFISICNVVGRIGGLWGNSERTKIETATNPETAYFE